MLKKQNKMKKNQKKKNTRQNYYRNRQTILVNGENTKCRPKKVVKIKAAESFLKHTSKEFQPSLE